MNTPQPTVHGDLSGLSKIRGSTVTILKVLNGGAAAVFIASDMRTANLRGAFNATSERLDHSDRLATDMKQNLEVFNREAKTKEHQLRSQTLSKEHATIVTDLNECNKMREEIKLLLVPIKGILEKLLDRFKKGEITLSTLSAELKPVIKTLDDLTGKYNTFQARVEKLAGNVEIVSTQTIKDLAIIAPTTAPKATPTPGQG